MCIKLINFRIICGTNQSLQKILDIGSSVCRCGHHCLHGTWADIIRWHVQPEAGAIQYELFASVTIVMERLDNITKLRIRDMASGYMATRHDMWNVIWNQTNITAIERLGAGHLLDQVLSVQRHGYLIFEQGEMDTRHDQGNHPT